MVNVQFDDPNIELAQFSNRRPQYSGLIGFLIKRGFAKDENAANVILIGVIVVCMIIVSFMLFRAWRRNIPQPIDPATIGQMRDIPPLPK